MWRRSGVLQQIFVTYNIQIRTALLTPTEPFTFSAVQLLYKSRKAIIKADKLAVFPDRPCSLSHPPPNTSLRPLRTSSGSFEAFWPIGEEQLWIVGALPLHHGTRCCWGYANVKERVRIRLGPISCRDPLEAEPWKCCLLNTGVN